MSREAEYPFSHLLRYQFLSRFDVVTSQEAETALVSVFSSQSERFEDLEFDGQSSR